MQMILYQFVCLLNISSSYNRPKGEDTLWEENGSYAAGLLIVATSGRATLTQFRICNETSYSSD